jgi:hypothetical protein
MTLPERESQLLFDKDHRETARCEFALDEQDFADYAPLTRCLAYTSIFKRITILLDAL